ncbi:metallophosphoesterase [Flavobacterium agricola]|uniref:Metallophosphoesterase n=1 Tax=Flavobacterium agricola TaxID=2870839 RepID=A0ABY6M245_9FLAO|nr:ShlB/FhaC/HecB family hemolysin secretion/activation protein [Flavobacterium agricola]UYW02506.1 metallophosphoesterase [Flavobacterium agricola]
MNHVFFKRSNTYIFTIFVMCFVFVSCATKKTQLGLLTSIEAPDYDSTQVQHRFFLVGAAGDLSTEIAQQNLQAIVKQSDSAIKSSLFFLGDNIANYKFVAMQSPPEALDLQIKTAKAFQGKTYFISGNLDWSNYRSLVNQEIYVNQQYHKNSYYPTKTCALDELVLSDNLVVITIDSQWFLANWNKYPGINDDCYIRTREEFFDAFENLINKYQNHTVLVAMHHPLFSNAQHGGKYSFHDHIFPIKNIPLPIVGSFYTYVRKASGIINQDLQNKKYISLINRIKTTIQNRENVFVVGGHDHSLQYIEKEGVKQIISGTGSYGIATNNKDLISFSSSKVGYAVVDVLQGGEAWLHFYRADYDQPIFTRKILENLPTFEEEVEEDIEATTLASIYSERETTKSDFYRFLWGDHYRHLYSIPIEYPNLNMFNSKYGRLIPTLTGRGNQITNLHLVNEEGQEFVLSPLKKNASKFLQKDVIKDKNIEKRLIGTYAESFVNDFYTTAHPFAPTILNHFANAIGIYSTNPVIYFVPKQQGLGIYNQDFGNALYLVEERVNNSDATTDNYDSSEAIYSTSDMMEKLRLDFKHKVDAKLYLKTRLFDILIGDWDRNEEHWRWAEFHKQDSIIFKPIPRNHDQAFAKIDGVLLGVLRNMPALRHMQNYSEKFAHPRWINKTTFSMDVKFLTGISEQEWLETVAYIQAKLTDEVINETFAQLPAEVVDATTDEIKTILQYRRDHLARYVLEFRNYLSKTIIISGTDLNDHFEIERLPNGDVKVTIYDASHYSIVKVSSAVYSHKITDEIWIYGLDEEDKFHVFGDVKSKILIRLIGGLGMDTYNSENGSKLNVYDFQTNKNVFELNKKTRVLLSDNYRLNLYDWRKAPMRIFTMAPQANFNPDDGTIIGLQANYKIDNFLQNPFGSQHSIGAKVSTLTGGVNMYYYGRFANLSNDWRFELFANYSTPNFSQNFFGFGNETENNRESSVNYYRVRMQNIKLEPAYKLFTPGGVVFGVSTAFEYIKVDRNANRFITSYFPENYDLYKGQYYAVPKITFDFENYNLPHNPSLGLGYNLEMGWYVNLQNESRNVPFLHTRLNFDFPLNRSQKLILATLSKAKFTFTDNFEFFQGANLGGDDDLRGFRRERFSGQNSFLQSTDIRWNIGTIGETIAPMEFGIYFGYDIGKVWKYSDPSKKWHSSYGTGIWLSIFDALTGHVAYFKGSDGGRVTGGIGFRF